MKRRTNIFYLMVPLLLCLVAACGKEGELVVPPVLKTMPFSMDGFILGEPLEQYFDGVKVRELYGSISLSDQASKIAFEKNEITMELRRKSNGETVYQQKFDIGNDTSKVPIFYFDGIKMNHTYTYPTPQGNEYLANFYFDFPKGAGAVDVVVEVVEYYFDESLTNPLVIVDTTFIPLATNIQPGKWSDYIVLKELPELPKHHPASEFQPFVRIRKAGVATYYASVKGEENEINVELPYAWTTAGKVQSLFIGWQAMGAAISLKPQQNLADIFKH
ncbi:hypothetical protein [Chitinophaga sp.]|uniref:hypothetical protein n=1 Tax=Chitinophaga sp. TaxID=1869181 RepID=UPI002F94DDDA